MDYRRRTKQKITASKSSNRIHWEMIRESIDVGSLFSCVIFVQIIIKAKETEFYKETQVSYQLTVSHHPVTVPEAVSGLIYNGKDRKSVV